MCMPVQEIGDFPLDKCGAETFVLMTVLAMLHEIRPLGCPTQLGHVYTLELLNLVLDGI